MYSKEYIKELQNLHADPKRKRGFGGKIKDLGEFHAYMNKWSPKSVLDYGCGKGLILNVLRENYPNVAFHGYDPAVPMFNKLKDEKFDCIFSNDVLEHIEPNYISDVLNHINNIATKYIWLRIDTLPARKTLSDGRNAHLILESPSWWIDQIYTYIGGDIVYQNLNKKGKFDVAIEK